LGKPDRHFSEAIGGYPRLSRGYPNLKMFLAADLCSGDPDQTGPKTYLEGETPVPDAAPHLPRLLAAP